MEAKAPVARIGRYLVFDEIGSGGMATVFLGRLEGASGFARVVALKRLHERVSKNADASAMLRDEAWLSARVKHPNVVPVLDVVEDDGALILVMEYVEGVPLTALLEELRKTNAKMPIEIAAAVLASTLSALEAAHTASDEDGAPLGLIHRDLSPHNILVGFDGIVRLVDFGVAKARGRIQTTSEGELKGKFAYMAPEYVGGGNVTVQSDLYAAGAVLWECLAGERMRPHDDPATVLTSVLFGEVPSLEERRPEVPKDALAIVSRALSKDPAKRYENAAAMNEELARALESATPRDVAAFVTRVLGGEVARIRAMRANVERVKGDELALAQTTASSRPPPAMTSVETTSATVRSATTNAGRYPLAAYGIALVVVVLLVIGAAVRSQRLRSHEEVAAAAVDVPSSSVSAAPTAPLPSQAIAPPPASVSASPSPRSSLDPVERPLRVAQPPPTSPSSEVRVWGRPPTTTSAAAPSGTGVLRGIPADRIQ